MRPALLIGLLASLLAAGVDADGGVQELHAENFDAALKQHQLLLVHFTAPWSQKCQRLHPILARLSANNAFLGLAWARSDISDRRGYTSYLSEHGVLKLPTLVLFVHGRPTLYSSAAPPTEDSLREWLTRETRELEQAQSGALGDAAAAATAAAAAAAAATAGEPLSPPLALDVGAAASGQEKPPQPPAQPPPPAQTKRSSVGGGHAGEGGHSGVGNSGAKRNRLDDESAAAAADDDDDAAAEASEVVGACVARTPVRDDDFEQVVLDKQRHVFVLFYTRSAEFCAADGGGAAYAAFDAELRARSADALAVWMDVDQNKTPYIFEPSELPVVMLFPQTDKRPLEFSGELSFKALVDFAKEQARLDALHGAQPPKDEV